LYRNDVENGNRSIRFRLVGTKSNRDGIGAVVRLFVDGRQQTRMVRSGSSYLSQSELPVTFGVGKQEQIERVVVDWPSGRTEEHQNLKIGKFFQVTEGKGIAEDSSG
jgi:enediyne biosynthesis protein E4